MRASRFLLSLDPEHQVAEAQFGARREGRGAVFRDGNELLTPALENAIDAISRDYEGFYFGRYDIRTESAEALARGEDFKILELNGVTSEATSIHVNLIWSPVPKMDFGIEYMHANREVESGADGDLDRIQFSAKYAY